MLLRGSCLVKGAGPVSESKKTPSLQQHCSVHNKLNWRGSNCRSLLYISPCASIVVWTGGMPRPSFWIGGVNIGLYTSGSEEMGFLQMRAAFRKIWTFNKLKCIELSLNMKCQLQDGRTLPLRSLFLFLPTDWLSCTLYINSFDWKHTVRCNKHKMMW